jgi:hypothetical protein
MPRHFAFRFAACLLAAATAGCSNSHDGSSPSGKGSVRGLHAVPELGTVSFLIEETVLSNLDYREASGISEYDDLNYDFNFDILLPGDTEATRLATRNITLDPERAYTFVLSGTLEDPSIVVWDEFGRDWDQEIEDADGADIVELEVSFGHIDAGLGAVDVYLEEPGTSPRSAMPRGTLAHGEFVSAVEIEEGDYQLVVTPEDDPDTILFASGKIALPSATSNLFVIMDSAGLTTGNFSVRWVGAGQELTDIFVEPELEVLHGAYGTGTVDVVVGDDFAEPFAAAVDYSELAESTELDKESAYLTITPAGNPGVFLAQKEIDLVPDSFNRLLLMGLPGSMQAVLFRHDQRRLATHARVQIFQAAARFQTMDIYLVSQDVDITLAAATYPRALFGSGSGYVPRAPDASKIVLTEPGTKNIIGGPFSIELEAGRNYGIAIVDAPDITTADILVFD